MGGLDSSPMVLLLVLQLLKRLLFVSVESGAPIEADAAGYVPSRQGSGTVATRMALEREPTA